MNESTVTLKKTKKSHRKICIVDNKPSIESKNAETPLDSVFDKDDKTPVIKDESYKPIVQEPHSITYLNQTQCITHTQYPPSINKTRKNKKVISPTEKAKLWDLFDIGNHSHSIEIDDVSISVSQEMYSMNTQPQNTDTHTNTPPTPTENTHSQNTSISAQSTHDVSKTPDNSFRNIDPDVPPSLLPILSSTPTPPPLPASTDTQEEMYKIRHLCQRCDSVLLIMEDGIPTCVNPQCGLIYTDVIDYSPEWKFYGCGNGDNKHTADITRCGNPINPLLMESSFGCKILCNNNSSFEMKRIRKWTEWTSTPHREKSLYEEFLFITTMAHNSGIPKIFIDYAMMIHKDISEQKMFRGMNRDGIKAASIYISCRLNGCPRTAHEIAEIFKLDKQSTTLGCSNAIKILNNIERNVEHSNKSEFKTTTASSFIERYCCKLGISQELTLLAKFIAIKTEQTELLCNNTPQSSAAGIIQFISQTFHLGISKMNIKTVCGVSEVTIGKCSKKMESIREQLIPKSMMVKYGIS
jgi:transcription initiation factor TFIIB